MIHTTGFVGRFCSYPQGEVSFLPQLIGAIPVILSWAALPWTPWFGEEEFPYACVEWKEYGTDYHECYALHLTAEDYWSPEAGLGKRWGVAIQMGTLFAIISLIVGGTAYVLLLSSMCFPMTATKLRMIQISFLVASFFAFMTICSLGVDECSDDDRRRRLSDESTYYSSSGSSSPDKCEREGVHLMEGGVLFMLAFIFYIVAAGFVEVFRRWANENNAEETSQDNSHDEQEQKKLIGTTPDVEDVEIGEADV